MFNILCKIILIHALANNLVPLPLPFFRLDSSFLRKPKPICFLPGTIAKEPVVLLLSCCSEVRLLGLGRDFSVSDWRRGGLCTSLSLLVSSVWTDLCIPPLASSSACIWLRREDRLIKFFFWVGLAIVLVVETNLSKSATSLDEASALSCFPRFRMVSWHSANFDEAVVISQPWTLYIYFCLIKIHLNVNFKRKFKYNWLMVMQKIYTERLTKVNDNSLSYQVL